MKMTHPAYRTLKTAPAKVVEFVESRLIVVMFCIIAGFSLMQIVLRNFFSTGIVWGDTMLRHMTLWVWLLGAARATSEDGHIRIDLLSRLLPERAKICVGVACDAFSFCVTAVLFYASWVFIGNERIGGAPAFLDVPFWLLETIFPISFGLMALRYAGRVFVGLLFSRIGGEK